MLGPNYESSSTRTKIIKIFLKIISLTYVRENLLTKRCSRLHIGVCKIFDPSYYQYKVVTFIP